MSSSNTTPFLRAFAAAVACAREHLDPDVRCRALTRGQQRRMSFDRCTA
jgi:hypothetical protein